MPQKRAGCPVNPCQDSQLGHGPKSSLWFQLAITSHVFPGLIPFLRGSEDGKRTTRQKVLDIGTPVFSRMLIPSRESVYVFL
jgi:hypothetical protein